MEKIRSILMVGVGAVGSAVAQKLHDLEPGLVRVLAEGERAARYRAQGFLINGRRYDLPVSEPQAADAPADLIIVAVKQYHLEAAIAEMRPFVGAQTVILSLMNGISSEAMLGEAFGSEKVLYGLVIGIDGNRSGNQVRFNSAGTIHFGEADNTVWSGPVTAVAWLFETAGVAFQVPADMLHALWYKFMMNVGINQASASLLAPYGVFQRVPEAEELVEAAMREVIAIANSRKIPLSEQDILRWRKVLAGMPPDSNTSMVDDLLNGRQTELDMLAGTVIRLGRECGLPTPVNETLYRLIRTRERERLPR